MTVLLTVAVNPSNNDKPYILMGSDSLQIKGHGIYSDEGELIDIDEYYRDDRYEKKFEINRKLIGLTGRYNEDFNELILNSIKENDVNAVEMSKLLHDYTKKLVESDKDIENQRITITIGTIEKGVPILSYIEVDTRDLPETILDTIELKQKGSFVPVFAGNRKKTIDLQENFNQRVMNNSINFNMTSVRKAANEYLVKSAERYPLTCNTNITFKRLR